MCRLCPVPEWSEPIKIVVPELPAFFAKQISWNFERLNFGNGAVIDTLSGRAERPTITGKVGCKLKDGMRPLSNRSNIDRYLLVSECLFCPGRRYGCTPRANCTGKRRHCYAQCKVSIYGDNPEMSEVYFSGSHGVGNITDVNKHRVPAAVRNQLKRKRMEGASPDEALMWFKKYVEDQGLNSDDPRLVPNGNQVRHMLKRVRPSIGPTMATPENIHTTYVSEITPKATEEQNDSAETNKHETNSTEVAWSAEGTGEMSDEDVTPETSSTTNPSKTTVHVTFTPLNSPLNTPFTMPSSRYALSPSVSDALRSQGSQPGTLLLAQSPIRSSSANYLHVSKKTSGCPTSSLGLSKRQANIQLEGKAQEITILRHHIRILENENLSKISHIAELETELHGLKEHDLLRLESQVQRLETENLKKDVRILQLEKQLRNVNQQNEIENTNNHGDEESEVIIPDIHEVHIEQSSIDNGNDNNKNPET